MTSSDLDEGVDARTAEIDRSGDAARTDPVEIERDLGRSSSMLGRLRPANGARRSPWGGRVARMFFVASALCFAGSLVVPSIREVLIPLAAIGLFGGVLTYGLAGGRYIEAEDCERVYGASADNLEALMEALGLSDERIYVPPSDTGSGVRLLVPGSVDAHVRGPVDNAIVDPYGRGLLLEPIGAELYDEFRDALTGSVASSPELLAEQLTDALLQRFEFVADADPTVSVDERRAAITVSGGAFGPIDRFDHPVASFLAVGFAAGLDRRVSLEVSAETDEGLWLISCRWEAENASQ